jgi:phospholipase C
MSHTTLAALDMDGFYGNIPKSGTKSNKGGWGCDSGLQAKWSTTGNPPYVLVPSCVPDQQGNLGPTWDPYSGKTAPYVPTLMDRMQSAGVSWKIYGSGGPSGGGAYGWAICPTFWKCLDPQGSQYPNFTRAAQFINDAKSGDLPQVSIVTPIGYNSQHGTTSWLTGDNWMGSLIDAMTTPNATDGTGGAWSHSTVFISWDDFGGFYDHVAPTNKLGIRLPMVIAGPYVKAGYTVGTNNLISADNATTWANLAAYIESVHPAVQPINTQDKGAYDLSDAFNYSQTPLPAPAMVTSAIPARSRRLIAAHPFHAENEVT